MGETYTVISGMDGSPEGPPTEEKEEDEDEDGMNAQADGIWGPVVPEPEHQPDQHEYPKHEAEGHVNLLRGLPYLC